MKYQFNRLKVSSLFDKNILTSCYIDLIKEMENFIRFLG